MSSVFHVIEEEFERLNEAKQAYEAAIKREEQGAPQIKHGGGHKDYLTLPGVMATKSSIGISAMLMVIMLVRY